MLQYCGGRQYDSMETRVPLPWFWTRSAPSVRSLSPADWSPQSCDCPGKPPHSHRSSLWPVHSKTVS